MGFHKVDSIKPDVLVADTLLRMNLKLSYCRGQCYDSASNMAGARSGNATQLSAEEPRAVYIHTATAMPSTLPLGTQCDRTDYCVIL